MPSASARASRASAISRGGVFQARACAFFQQKWRQPAPGSSGGPPLWPMLNRTNPVLSSAGVMTDRSSIARRREWRRRLARRRDDADRLRFVDPQHDALADVQVIVHAVLAAVAGMQ